MSLAAGFWLTSTFRNPKFEIRNHQDLPSVFCPLTSVLCPLTSDI